MRLDYIPLMKFHMAPIKARYRFIFISFVRKYCITLYGRFVIAVIRLLDTIFLRHYDAIFP